MISREKICPELEAKKIYIEYESGLLKKVASNKMFIEMIHLGAIKLLITFKLEKRAVEIDIGDPAKAFGALNLAYTLLAAVASIS